MKLKLIRNIKTEKSTIGELHINGIFECYTLEDAERKEKIKEKTAIPKGIYEVIIDFSNRFKKLMPHILNVPSFEGIRIHAGNTDVDTDGCILVGKTKDKDFIGQSRLAYSTLFEKLREAFNKKEKIEIEIV